MHELVHLKRRDLIYKLIIFIGTTIHWFNPVIYLMSKISFEDLELSCDEVNVEEWYRYKPQEGYMG